MPASTEILSFATGGSANVLTQAQYAALTSVLTNGFTTGTAQAQQLNKVWRQSSFVAAGLANWMVNRGISVPDDGNLSALVAEIESALDAFLNKSVAGSADVTLVPTTEAVFPMINLIGVITANINVIVPSVPGRWVFTNNTSGNFTLTVKTATGTGVAIPQGASIALFSDGADVKAPVAAASAFFQPHSTTPPTMIVEIGSGKIQSGATLTSVAKQTTSTFVAPITNPRNDLIVIDSVTGIYSIVAGTENASPVDPVIPASKIAVARIRLTVGMVGITEANIDDYRPEFYIASTSSIDTTARDQIALTNMRQILFTSVTTGPLVMGKEWKLATDEWASSSTGQTYVAPGTYGYYTNAVGSSLYTPTGSTFGNTTANGGLAAAFDGNVNQASSACATTTATGTVGYVGKAFASAQPISRVDVTSSNNLGFTNTPGASRTINIYGKSSAPANPTDGALLGSITFNDANSLQTKSITFSPASYQYVWAELNPGVGNLVWIGEVQYYVSTDGTASLIPPAAVPVSVAPVFMDGYFLWDPASSGAVLGTDLVASLSRDGGTTYTVATLTNLVSFDGTYSVIKARADVSGQPSATNMLLKIQLLSSKVQKVAAPSIYSE